MLAQSNDPEHSDSSFAGAKYVGSGAHLILAHRARASSELAVPNFLGLPYVAQASQELASSRYNSNV